MATEGTPLTLPAGQDYHATTTSRLKKYRGGFHTSICDIFRNPNRRTDCCAVACCGVLSSDRSSYLLTGKRPPSLWMRVLIWLIIPILFIAAMGKFAVEVPLEEPDPEDESDLDDGHTQKVIPAEIFWPFVIYLVLIIVYSFVKKRNTRKDIMRRLYEERARERGEEVNSQQLESFLQRHNLDVKRAHSCCSICYIYDDNFRDERGMLVRNNLEEDAEYENDACTFVWDFISSLFWCCGCWCQCFGCCAIGQEEREVNRLTDNEQPKIDYLTFQPYEDYYPAIIELRENQIKSLWKHMQSISELSSKLLKNVAAVIVVLVLFALSDIDANFTWENLIVLLLTLGQAFFIEHIVHWKWNRFDISFDAVVKYFGKLYHSFSFIMLTIYFYLTTSSPLL